MRCAYCHDELGEARQTCGACGSHVHPDCGATLGGCPTLGCARAIARLAIAKPVERSTEPSRPPTGRARRVLAGILCLVVAGFCCVPLSRPTGPHVWARELAEPALAPGVADAARRVMRDRAFVERVERRGERRVGPGSPLWAELPQEVQRLGTIAVTSSWIEMSAGGGFGSWGVIIDLDPSHQRPRDEHGWTWRRVGPGVWTYVTP